jgi:L-malate glycosyltransferase
MRIGLFCPFTQGPTRGNITSVQRIAKYLQLSENQISLIPLDAPDRHRHLQQLVSFSPDVLHAFHAFHAGPTTRNTAHKLGVPYLITLTGSDLFEPTLRDHPKTISALNDATAITCFDQLVAGLAAQFFPQIAKKLVVIPQGVEPLTEAVPLERPDNAFIILLPAALRPVKGVDYAIEQLSLLAAERPQLQLWIAGGNLDNGYTVAIANQVDRLPWVKLLGEIPHLAMGSLYATANMVLNSSQFEGGMANALLEAMAQGKPVLARNVPGNRSLISHGETGWLYQDGVELCNLTRHIMDNPSLRDTVARQGQRHVLTYYSPQHEAALLEQLYRSLLSAPS